MNETEHLLNKLFDKVEAIDAKIDSHNLYVEKELGRRPSRGELYSFLGFTLAVYGTGVAFVVL